MKAIAKLKDDARRFELREEWGSAINAYLEVIRLMEHGDGSDLDLPLYNRVGDLYVRLGRPADAVIHYEQAADHYADAGLYNNAIALCNKALRYESARLPLLRKLGAFSASQGFYTDARRWYLEYVEKSIKGGAIDDAFSALSDLAHVSDDPEIRELLAYQLREHGRDQEAIQELQRAHALRIAAGQHAEAAAVAAELQRLDPGIVLSTGGSAAPETSANHWARSGELPGFAESDAVTPEAVTESIAPNDELVLERDPEGLDVEALSLQGHTSQEGIPEDSGEDNDSARSSERETLELEVEEPPALFDLSALDVGGETSHYVRGLEAALTPEDSVSASYDDDDTGIELEDQTLDLPILDYADPADLDTETADQFDDSPLPVYDTPEPGGQDDQYQDFEFGEYAVEPPRRVFDFEEETTEPGGAVDESDDAITGDTDEPDLSTGSEWTAEIADDVPIDDRPVPDSDLEAAEEFREAAFDYDSQHTFEAPSLPVFGVADEPEIELADQPQLEGDEQFGADSPLEAELRHEVESQLADTQLDPEPEFETGIARPAEPFAAEPPAAQPPAERFEGTGQTAEPGVHAEPSSPVTPQPAAPVRPSTDYVDLAALLGEDDDDQAEESTRFVVAEMPPTGDEEKDFADMLQQFKDKVAQSIPKEDAGSHYDLGIAFKEMGLIDEAIGEFQTALRSERHRLKVYEELGSCFMMKQQYGVAITVLNRAQQMAFTDETELLGVYYNLGRAHEEQGQRAEARAAFEKIIAVDIGFRDTTERLARL